tara:strand:- start:978 stop:3953 length:2976 start_codon:yes stop_codon:yes gene_type:complete
MKKLILLLLLIPQLVISQDSWFKLEVQFDYYADDESFALITQAGDTLVNYQPANPFEFYSTVVQADSGELAISLLDSWGDGWQGGPQNNNSGTIASIKISNECQGTILDLDVTALGNFSQYDTTVNLLPCPPPVCSIDSTNAYQVCLSNEQTLVVWEWENGWCDPVNVKYWNEEGWGPFYQGVNPGATNYGMLAGNGQMPPNWEVEYYFQVEFSDGTLSDTISYTPDPCIKGCMDPNSPTYNPWATVDDGSCSGTTCDETTEYQVTMQITLDNWPSETSWIMNSGGVIGEAPVGTYDFNDIQQTYSYTFCVDQSAGFELIVNDTYGDGMVGTQQSGPGSIIIFDCAGDTIWEMDNPNFGNVLYSGQQFGNPCPTIPDVYGCTDPAYQEYNDTANIDDGSCANLHVVGCMDTNSINYDPLATQQAIVDSCEYTLTIEDAAGDGWGNSYIGLYQGDTAIGTYTMGPGSNSQSWTLNLPTDKPLKVYYFEVGNPQQQPQEVQFQTWHNSFILENADGVVLLDEGSNPFANNGQGALQNFDAPFWTVYEATPYCGDLCIPIVEGCMDSTALNYNPDANVDDGTCIPYIEGCMNDLAFNYDPNATVDDGSCIPVIVGCMDPTAFNYITPIGDPLVDVNTDDPSLCIPVLLGCTDPTSFNYDANANTDDGSCVPVIEGCTDPSSFNYDSTANTDDGSCIPTVLGCTDPQAFNYDPAANTDDGSCIAVVYGCTDPNAFNYDPAANTDNGSCEAIIYGCTDSTSFNYDPLANTDNGSCIPIVYGCMDENSFNYDPNANINQVSETDFTNPCIPIVYGCMDSTAVNYDSTANVDNGSCITAIVGCTDPNSYNYNPEANVADDESCLYDAGCVTGPGEPYWLNNQCYAWVIDVDNYCCDNDWDPVCQEMYNYCENGWPDGINIDGRFSRFSGIVVYPNPAEDLINITSDLDIRVNLYDMSGKILKENITDKTIDLSNLPSGVYFLNIEHEGNIYNKRIIKE